MPARKPAAGNRSLKQMLATLSAQPQRPRRPQQVPPSKPQELPVTLPVVLPQGEQEANPAEPETATSSYLTGEKRKCAANKKDGAPCRANPLPSSEHCIFHAPAYAERVQEARIEGGRRSPYELPDRADHDIWNVDFSLYTRGGLQGSMEAVMRLLILGRIPTRHASILMRFFEAAIRNLHGVDSLAGPEFGGTIQDFLRTSGLIQRDLEDQALRERLDQITDTGARRQEILKANESFGYTAPTPKQQPASKAMEPWDHDRPHREPFSPTGFWGLPPGTGEGGKLTMDDLFPNGLPEHQQPR